MVQRGNESEKKKIGPRLLSRSWNREANEPNGPRSLDTALRKYRGTTQLGVVFVTVRDPRLGRRRAREDGLVDVALVIDELVPAGVPAGSRRDGVEGTGRRSTDARRVNR